MAPDGRGAGAGASVRAPTLAARGLRIVLGGRPVVDSVDAAFGPGWCAVVGPNGAGKSTLLRALAGLRAPDAGTVALDGRSLASLAPRERARAIGWLAQQAEPSGELTVRETVALGRLAHLGALGAPSAADAAVVDRAMAALDCSAWAGRSLAALSGGERQRVLVARLLATEAPVLLLDEPTTHLDPPHQAALVRLLRAIAPTRTVVTVLHDLPLALHAGRLLVLAGGRVKADGAPAHPAVRGAVEAVFGGAVRVTSDATGRPLVGLDVGPGRSPESG